MDAVQVQKRHYYGDLAPRNRTLYGTVFKDNILPRLTDELVQSCDYHTRVGLIDRFNSESRVIKKGIAFVPVKFGLCFTQTHLNQAGALIHIFTDGSVLLSHGGTEMGQGLHDKVAHVPAHELCISTDRIRTAAVHSTRVANTSPTAASTSSDLNGRAAVNAARVLKQRLLEFAAQAYQQDPGSLPLESGQLRAGACRFRS